MTRASWFCGGGTYKGHDLADGALDMETFVALDANKSLAGSNRREQHIAAIGLKNLANLVQAVEEDAVNLGGGDGDVLHVDPGAGDGVVNLLLGHGDGLFALAGDEDVGGIAALGVGGAVAVHLREGRGEVDGGAGGGLDELDVLALASAHELVERQVELEGIRDAAELKGPC
jgi:hypothetical protein